MSKPLNLAAQAPALPKLNEALDHSEKIHGVVADCAAELSAVNTRLEQTLSRRPDQPALAEALEKNEAVEVKVQICADDLTQVNRALNAEIQERHLLEQALASAQQDAAVTQLASLHDPLTGLPNRGLFNDRLEQGLAQARRHGWTLAVMFIDLDNFKSVNDSHGHHVGDLLLKAIAARLKSVTREDDTVSRHGGDEFLYLLMKLRQDSDASPIAEKIIASICAPIELNSANRPITVSVGCSLGIAIFPRNGSTGLTLIAGADRAMYQAKRNGGGYAYDPGDPEAP